MGSVAARAARAALHRASGVGVGFRVPSSGEYPHITPRLRGMSIEVLDFIDALLTCQVVGFEGFECVCSLEG